MLNGECAGGGGFLTARLRRVENRAGCCLAASICLAPMTKPHKEVCGILPKFQDAFPGLISNLLWKAVLAFFFPEYFISFWSGSCHLFSRVGDQIQGFVDGGQGLYHWAVSPGLLTVHVLNWRGLRNTKVVYKAILRASVRVFLKMPFLNRCVNYYLLSPTWVEPSNL